MSKREPLQILRVRDSNEKHYVKKNDLFDIPFRLLIIGKSQSGKSNVLTNFLLNDDDRFYKNDFDGSDIYIWSPSAFTDRKIIMLREEHDVPNSNVFTKFDENVIEAVYELLKDEYNDAINNKEKPTPKLFIFDDMSAGGNLKKSANGIIAKVFMNGRHILLSCIVTSQKYADILTGARENATGLIMFSGTDRQLEQISDDHNFLEDKKSFRKMFRDHTNERFSFLVVNYHKPLNKGRYMNKNFQPIDISQYS
tara:strand:- start:10813 stop:11571 length:759 start_codon:yes stop_codon:yes gene_type:complete